MMASFEYPYPVVPHRLPFVVFQVIIPGDRAHDECQPASLMVTIFRLSGTRAHPSGQGRVPGRAREREGEGHGV